MSKSKAFVCFCVDGPSDIDALHIQFEDLFDEIGGDDINVAFRYADFQGENHGDITTLKGVDPENVQQMIYKYYFKQQDRGSDLGWEDLTHIIHIIDLDGAYVSDDNIHGFDKEEEKLARELGSKGKAKKVLYMGDHIAVKNEFVPNQESPVQQMCNRNKRKRQIIDRLLSLDVLTAKKKEVKYELYYFSTNLDHFLYGDANLSGPQKMRKASEFSSKYGDGDSLSEFFENSEFSTKHDYDSSWRALYKGNSSLARGSNVNLLIEKIKESSIEDWM